MQVSPQSILNSDSNSAELNFIKEHDRRFTVVSQGSAAQRKFRYVRRYCAIRTEESIKTDIIGYGGKNELSILRLQRL